MSVSWDNFIYDPNTPNFSATQNTTKGTVTNRKGRYMFRTDVDTSQSPCYSFIGGDHMPICTNTEIEFGSQVALYFQDPPGSTDPGNCVVTCAESQCVTIDAPSTCTLGMYGTSTTKSTILGQNCGPGPNFSTDPGDIWVNCGYSFDYTVPIMPDMTLNNVWLNWVTDVYTGLIPSTANATRFRDHSVVYAYTNDLFNKMYSTGYYGTGSGNDLLQNLYNKSFSDYLSGLYEIFSGSLNSLYPTDVTPGIVNILTEQNQNTTFLTLPQIRFVNNSYYIDLTVGHLQYQEYKTINDWGAYISNLLFGLLQDSQATIQNGTSAPTATPNPVITVVSDIPLYFDFIQSVITGTSSANTVPIGGRITVEIVYWSPMLFVYAQQFFPNIQFTSNTYDCLNFIGNYGMLPNVCPTSLPIQTILAQYCGVQYNPPPFVPSSVANSVFLLNNNGDCLCYNSKIQSASQYRPGDTDAMCFDLNCSDEVRQAFGLSDSDCKKSCGIVQDWFDNENPADQPMDGAFLDKGRYKNICGKDIVQYVDTRKLIPSVLIGGIIISVFVGLLVFSICRHMELGTIPTILLTTVICSVFLGLFIFVAFDFVGTPEVEQGPPIKFVCRSKYTHTNIPTQFCDRIFNTECITDANCSSTCTCESGTCVNRDGEQRKSTEKTVKEYNLPILITGGIMVLLFPIVLMYLYRDYHFPVEYGTYLTGLILLDIVLLVFIVKLGYTKRTETVFLGTCGQ